MGNGLVYLNKQVGQQSLLVRRGDHAERTCCVEIKFRAAVTGSRTAVDDDPFTRVVDGKYFMISILKRKVVILAEGNGLQKVSMELLEVEVEYLFHELGRV